MGTIIKLNLGCGDKLYQREEGWVNVDVCFEEGVKTSQVVKVTTDEGFIELEDDRKEYPLAIFSDITNLKHIVEDSTVDEIHAYHVIEHFEVYKVNDILKEWLRMLKPGGKLILEQPDLIKACQWFLKGVKEQDEKILLHMAMLPFYGQPDPKAPLMAHKWGWWPESLAYAMDKAGLKNIEQHPAETHMKDVRDFRLVGEKEIKE